MLPEMYIMRRVRMPPRWLLGNRSYSVRVLPSAHLAPSPLPATHNIKSFETKRSFSIYFATQIDAHTSILLSATFSGSIARAAGSGKPWLATSTLYHRARMERCGSQFLLLRFSPDLQTTTSTTRARRLVMALLRRSKLLRAALARISYLQAPTTCPMSLTVR